MEKGWIILGIGSVLMATAIYLYNETIKEIGHMDFSNLTVV